MLSFIIKETDSDQTLISFLKKRFRDTPLGLIYKLFRTKKVKVNEKDVRYYHHRLKKGEEIKIYDSNLKQSSQVSYSLSQPKTCLEVVYEDNNILITLKEHGVTAPNLDNAVRYYLFQKNPSEYQKQVQDFFVLTAVHRLDKLTKGLVIYPKSPIVKRTLYKVISDKSKVTKKYLALCESSSKKHLPDYISGYLEKNSQEQRMVFSPSNSAPSAKYCALEIKEVDSEISHKIIKKHFSEYHNSVLFEITLHTGRKHQIRSILSYFDKPVIGDKKYGSKIEIGNKIFLLAYKIMFDNLSSPLSYLNEKEFQII